MDIGLRTLDFRKLPKVELHRHLEGSMRYRTLIELRGPTPARRHHFVRGERRGWKAFFDKFTIYRSIRLTPGLMRRLAREAVEDAAKDGVVHLELRFSPVFFARRAEGVDAVECARVIVGSARAEARRRRLGIRFLATIARQHTCRLNAPAVDAAVALRPWFVGIDVAGDE